MRTLQYGFLQFSIHFVLFLFVIPATAQNFDWLSGASGTSRGHGVTVDRKGNMYEVGSYDADTLSVPSFTIPPSLQPSGLTSSQRSIAFLSKHNVNNGKVLDMVIIAPDTSSNSTCSYSASSTFVYAHRVEYVNDSRIYVLGSFEACDLVFYDPYGNVVFKTATSRMESQARRIFLAVYDGNLNPLSCHVIGTDEQIYNYSADIVKGVVGGHEKIFLAGSVWGKRVFVESFGSAQAPSATDNPINTISAIDYEIYLARFDVSNDKFERAKILGGRGNDHPGEMASGYINTDADNSIEDLYLCGSYNDSIAFNIPGQGLTWYTTNSDPEADDIFTCRLDNFDLDYQYPVVAGGQYNDQALSISDDGKYVGGFVSDSAVFELSGGDTTIDGLGNAVFLGNTFMDKKENAFIAQPDYTHGIWISVDTVVIDPFCTQTNVLARAFCGEFYSSWTKGLHGNVVQVPWDPIQDHMESFLDPETSGHTHFSHLIKWTDTSGVPVEIWEHNFWPTPNIGNDTNIQSTFIEDLELNIYDELVQDYTDWHVDLVFTGRCGPDITLPWTHHGSNSFDGNFGSYNSGVATMYIAGMQEIPKFNQDTFRICLEDSAIISTSFVHPYTNDTVYNVDTNSIYFTGDSIQGVLSGAFYPPGYGVFTLQANMEYFGCLITDQCITVIVEPKPFARQPETYNNDWAEGLAASGMPHTDLIAIDSGINYDIYYLAGKYDDLIEFEASGGGTISLTSSSGNESGYIVAYGPCGALWAINIDGNGMDYIEHLKYMNSVSLPDGVKPHMLLAAGGVEASTTITHHASGGSLTSPATSVNGITLASIPTGVKKGILMMINPISGQVDSIFIGGDNINQSNVFHGLAALQTHDTTFIALTGERSTAFTSGSFSLGATVGGDDPFVLLIDDKCNIYGTNVSNSLGTVNDDHGDAVDMQLMNGDHLMITSVGYFNTGTWNEDYTNEFGTNPIAVADGLNFYLAKDNYFISSSNWQMERIKVYDGEGDDYAYDVKITSAYDTSHFFPHQIFFCGSFSDSLRTYLTGAPVLGTSGSNDFDIFIGVTDNALADQWFNHEGSDQNFTTESARSLEKLGTNLFVYGERQEGNGNIVSDYYDNSGSYVGSGMLNAQTPNILSGRADLFTARFDTVANLIDFVEAKANGQGINNANDITFMDTNFVNAGKLTVGPSGNIEFNDSTNSLPQSTMIQNSNISDAFFTRTTFDGLGHYKRGTKHQAKT